MTFGLIKRATLPALAVSVLSFGTPGQAQLTLEIPEAEFEEIENYKPIPVPDPSGGPVNQMFEYMELDLTGTMPEAVLEEMLGETPYDFVDVVWGMEVTGDWSENMTGEGTLQVTDFTEGRGASLRADPNRFTGQQGFHMYSARLQTDGDHVFTLSAAFPAEEGGVALGTEIDGVKSLFEVTWLCHMFEPWRTGCVDFPDEYYETDLPVLNKMYIQRKVGGYKIDFSARVFELRAHRDRGYRLTEPSGRFADVRGWVCDRASWKEDPEDCAVPEPLQVIENSPPHQRENVHLQTPQIEMAFNFPVDADDLDENFSLTTRHVTGEPLKTTGRILSLSDNRFRFEPDDDLLSGVIYEARIEGGEDGVRGRDGEVLNSGAHWWRFTTLVDLENHGGPVEEPVRTHVYQTVRDAPLVVDKPALQRIYVDWQPHVHIHEHWQAQTYPAELEINVIDQGQWRIDPQKRGSIDGDVVRVVRSDLLEGEHRREIERLARNTINVYGWVPDQQGGTSVIETRLTPNDPFPSSAAVQDVIAEKEVEHWDVDPDPLVLRYAFFEAGDWSDGVPESDRQVALAALEGAEELAQQIFPIREVRSVFTGVEVGRSGPVINSMRDLLKDLRGDPNLGVADDDVLIIFLPYGPLTNSKGKRIAGANNGHRFNDNTELDDNQRRGVFVSITKWVGFTRLPISEQAQNIVHEIAHNHGLEHNPGDIDEVDGIPKEAYADTSIEGFRITLDGMFGWNKSYEEGNGQWVGTTTPLMWPSPTSSKRVWINEDEYRSLMDTISN